MNIFTMYTRNVTNYKNKNMKNRVWSDLFPKKGKKKGKKTPFFSGKFDIFCMYKILILLHKKGIFSL